MKLTEEYNIKYCWDSLDYNYSLQYEPILKTKNKLIKKPKILDVYKNDSTYIIRISCGFYPTYYFNLYTSDNKLINSIVSQRKNEDYKLDFLFVVKIDDIKKGLFDVYANSEVEDYAIIELNSSENFYGKGELIQIKTIK